MQLNQQFGKERPLLQHSFYAAKSFCHILLPLLKSVFLSCRATKALEKASFRVRQLQQLREKYAPLDFRSIQGYQANWEDTTTGLESSDVSLCSSLQRRYCHSSPINRLSACQPTHQSETTARKLKPILTDNIFTDANRILTKGTPALCSAKASMEKFEA